MNRISVPQRNQCEDAETKQCAVRYTPGADYRLDLDPEQHRFLKIKVEAYHKTYDHLIDATLTSDGVVNYSKRNDAIGRASGLDLIVTYSTTGFYGWFSYGLLDARVTKQFETFGHPASAFLDVNNVFNWTNIQAYRYQFDPHGDPVVQAVDLWSILPTLGASVRFQKSWRGGQYLAAPLNSGRQRGTPLRGVRIISQYLSERAQHPPVICISE